MRILYLSHNNIIEKCIMKTILLYYMLSYFVTPIQNVSLEVNVSGIHSSNGKIFIGVYDSKEKFGDIKKVVDGIVIEATQSQVSHIFDLPKGIYAVAVFHDENNNGKLDKNMIGFPKEGYGLSSKNSKPGFSNASFQLLDNKTIMINLKY